MALNLAPVLLDLDQFETIVEALEFKEWKMQCEFDRQPKTRGGKVNPLRAAYQRELDAIARALQALKYPQTMEKGDE